MAGWLATALDPRFKMLSAASHTMQQEVMQELSKRINLFQPTNIRQNPKTDMSSFFEDDIKTLSLSAADIELQMYFSILPIPKYDPNDPLYETINLLVWWNDHKNSLPLLAEQARIFLGILATSVPAERLFSDTGNTLTDKHNCLSEN